MLSLSHLQASASLGRSLVGLWQDDATPPPKLLSRAQAVGLKGDRLIEAIDEFLRARAVFKENFGKHSFSHDYSTKRGEADILPAVRPLKTQTHTKLPYAVRTLQVCLDQEHLWLCCALSHHLPREKLQLERPGMACMLNLCCPTKLPQPSDWQGQIPGML